MTAQEMYIQVINDLQAIGSQRSRKYYPEQIELELNTTIEQYVTRAVKELPNGFYTVDSGYADAVQPLLEQIKLPVYLSSEDYLAELPLNVYKTLELGAKLAKCETVTATHWLTKTLSYFKLKPVLSTAMDKVYFKNVILTINGVVVYTRPTGGYTINDLNFLVDELLANFKDLGWEDRANLTAGGHFVLKTESTTLNTLAYDGVVYPFSLVKSVVVKEMKLAPSVLTPIRRIMNQSSIAIQKTAYYRPSVIELPALIKNYAIQVFTPQNSIVNELLITYIRKPRKISISLGIGSDLSPMIHSTICDKTVQRVRERIGDPKIQTGIVLEN